jgi:hypothetical protein
MITLNGEQCAIISMKEFKEYEQLKKSVELDSIRIIEYYYSGGSYSIVDYYGKDEAIKKVIENSDELRKIYSSLVSEISELQDKNEILKSSFINWLKNRNK